jgi:hypothetical protein
MSFYLRASNDAWEKRNNHEQRQQAKKEKRKKTKKEKRQWSIQNSAMQTDDVHLHPIEVTSAEL